MTDILVDRIAEDGEDFNSSNIDIVGYDAKSETLYVEFHSSGTVYSYAGVKESTFDMLVNADSVGSFYARHIKGTYDGEVAGEGVITLREDEVDLKPEQKWLSVPEGETPDFAQGGVVVNAEGIFGGTLSVPLVTPSRYGVKWTSDNLGAGPFEPEFQAMSEADALAQFNAQVGSIFGTDFHVKIVSVTHYFD